MTSAWAVGSFVEVTRLLPRPTIWPSLTTIAPNGPPWPALTPLMARRMASCMKAEFEVRCLMFKIEPYCMHRHFELGTLNFELGLQRRPDLPRHEFFVAVAVELALGFFAAGDGEDLFENFAADFGHALT